MNINKMLKDAQLMQSKLEKMQDEMANKSYDIAKNGLKISANGSKKILSIDIDEDLLDDREMLQDLLLVSMNDLFNNIDEDSASKMAQVTGGASIPGLF
ncbi:MAG: YbaB/EbfC family nucleoid-associated protein [Bacilli bacterium]|jgi:DNA-binding YbaB/EbfC family protein|nr:YbaB/EbfC family nucleoid-associated protein [Bacilli bacterium]